MYYGAVFGGSTSSILINALGVASTVATSFDGYPLTRQGKAGARPDHRGDCVICRRHGRGDIAGVFCPCSGVCGFAAHSSEYFALMVVGLSAIAAFAGSGQVTKALLMTIAGLVLATASGEGAQFNMPRFTMGIMDLQSGIGFITLAMATFAIPETLFLVLDPSRSGKAGDKQSEISDLRITKEEAKKITLSSAGNLLQGLLIGEMPQGQGQTVASFLGHAAGTGNSAPER